jgi:hypothetical protein
VRLEGLVELNNDLFGNRTLDLRACSIVPQPVSFAANHNYGAQSREIQIKEKDEK